MSYLQTFSEDRAETYELPKHYAVDKLAHEITVLEKKINSRETFILFLFDKDDAPFAQMNAVLDEMMEHRKEIEECRQAIRWIYEKL